MGRRGKRLIHNQLYCPQCGRTFWGKEYRALVNHNQVNCSNCGQLIKDKDKSTFEWFTSLIRF